MNRTSTEYFDCPKPSGNGVYRIYADERNPQYIPVQLTYYPDRRNIIRRTVLLKVLITRINFKDLLSIQIRHRGVNFELEWTGLSIDGIYRGFKPTYVGVRIPRVIPDWIYSPFYYLNDFNDDLIAVSTSRLHNSDDIKEVISQLKSILFEGTADQYYEIVYDSDHFKVQSHNFYKNILKFPTWEELNNY